MEDTIDFPFRVSGEAQVAAAVDKVASSIGNLSRENSRLQSSAGSVTGAFAKFQSSIGIVSQTVGQFSQTGGRMIGVIGQAAGSTAMLAASFGPVGIALGAATAAAGVAGAAFADMKRELDDTTDAVDTFAEHFKDAFDKSSLTQSAMRSFETAFKTLFGSTTSDALSTFNQMIRVTGVYASAIFNAMGQAAEVAALNIRTVMAALANGDVEGALASIAAAQQAGAAIWSSIDSAAGGAIMQDMIAQTAPTKGPNKARRRGGGGGRRREEVSDEEQALRDEFYTPRNLIARTFTDPGMEDVDLNKMNADAADLELEKQRSMIEQAIELKKIRFEAGEEELKQTQARIDKWGEYGAAVGTILTNSFEAALRGQKSLGRAIKDGFRDMLFGLAKSEAVKGLAALATAVGSTVENPPLAAAKYAEAGQHFAAAALAGGAGAAVGAIGGGGGGGRAGGANGGPRSAPRRDTSAGYGGDGEGRSINVNVNAPVMTASSLAEFGILLQRSLTSAQSRY